jgi:hypothetical protein
VARLLIELCLALDRSVLPYLAIQPCACTAKKKRTIVARAQAPPTDLRAVRCASNLALMLQQRLGAKPSLSIAPFVPFAAQRAAFNRLTLERAWCDGRRWFN